MCADSRTGARIAYHSSGMRSRRVDILAVATMVEEPGSNKPKTVFVFPTSTTSNMAFSTTEFSLDRCHSSSKSSESGLATASCPTESSDMRDNHHRPPDPANRAMSTMHFHIRMTGLFLLVLM